MNALIYTISLLISFLGIFIGVALSNIASEELNSIAPYTSYLKSIIIGLILFFSIHNYSVILASIITVITIIILTFVKHSDKWIYASCGALFYLSSKFNQLYTVSILIMLYGIILGTEGSIKFVKNKKLHMKDDIKSIQLLFENFVLYLAVAVLFYIAFEFIIL